MGYEVAWGKGWFSFQSLASVVLLSLSWFWFLLSSPFRLPTKEMTSVGRFVVVSAFVLP